MKSLFSYNWNNNGIFTVNCSDIGGRRDTNNNNKKQPPKTHFSSSSFSNRLFPLICFRLVCFSCAFGCETILDVAILSRFLLHLLLPFRHRFYLHSFRRMKYTWAREKMCIHISPEIVIIANVLENYDSILCDANQCIYDMVHKPTESIQCDTMRMYTVI